MKNKFNRLTSKEWLPFQKSWFRFKSTETLYEENLRFFCKAEDEGDSVFYFGNHYAVFEQSATRNQIKTFNIVGHSSSPIQYALFDLLDIITEKTTLQEYSILKNKIISQLSQLYANVLHRRFFTILIRNIESDKAFYPFAWDLAKSISSMLSLKDEKIGNIEMVEDEINNSTTFKTDKSTFYALYFRKDEFSDGIYKENQMNFFQTTFNDSGKIHFEKSMKKWFILKPQPRKKDEILHPAKYPEELVDMFVRQFTVELDNVFDPMSGTGSTQIGALRNKRNGYGTELSGFFSDLANKRCARFLAAENGNETFKILTKDVRDIDKNDFPGIDYMLTSPPYWDMLNMKGAENQALRKEKGLQTNYSDSDKDLGNINDYDVFLDDLVAVYTDLIELIKPGGYITIVVKNIKKKGKNYPFAWDLAFRLQDKLNLLPPVFWCQDDISIAPYGYGNTWVSNTFHQYCLNFQKK
ncbi:MAG: DNA methyltransferase [Paludibacteraceae bacterium]